MRDHNRVVLMCSCSSQQYLEDLEDLEDSVVAAVRKSKPEGKKSKKKDSRVTFGTVAAISAHNAMAVDAPVITGLADAAIDSPLAGDMPTIASTVSHTSMPADIHGDSDTPSVSTFDPFITPNNSDAPAVSIFNPFITPKDGNAPSVSTFNPFVTPKDGDAPAVSTFNLFITPKDSNAPPVSTFNPFVTPKDSVSVTLAHAHPGNDGTICADPFGFGSSHTRPSSGTASFDISLFSPATANNYNFTNAYHAPQHSLSLSSSSMPAPLPLQSCAYGDQTFTNPGGQFVNPSRLTSFENPSLNIDNYASLQNFDMRDFLSGPRWRREHQTNINTDKSD
jgi:hypothetical protein